MSNQNWNSGQGGYPQGGQGGYPQGGQGGYPQGGQGGYPQGGQGGYPQGPGWGGQQPAYDQTQQLPPAGYPSGNGPSGKGTTKLPLIIAGLIVLVGIVGVVIFLLTRGGGEATAPPASASASAAPSEPGSTSSEDPPILGLAASDLPEQVGDWELTSLSENIPAYVRGSKTISVISFGTEMDLQAWALGLEDPIESGGGLVVCGGTGDVPACLVQTAEFGVVNAGGADIEAADLTAFADEFAKAMN